MGRLCLVTRDVKVLITVISEKVWRHSITLHRIFAKIFTRLCWHQLSSAYWINAKFGMKMCNICCHVTGRIKTFKLLSGQNTNKMTKNVLFWPFLTFLRHIQVQSQPKQTGRTSCHMSKVIRQICYDVRYFFQGVRKWPKLASDIPL